MKQIPASETLRTLFEYDAELGSLVWRKRPGGGRAISVWNARYAGQKAGTPTANGYITVRIARRHFLAHRLIWTLVTGEQPPAFLDHRDRDKTNNRFENLRPATKAENMRNRGPSAKNNSGAKGVSWSRVSRKWQAHIGVDGRSIGLGLFDDVASAAAAYAAAARRYHGEFARTK